MKKSLLLFMCVLLMGFILMTGCAKTAQTPASAPAAPSQAPLSVQAPKPADVIKIKLSHGCVPTTLHQEFSLKFKEILEKYTNGRVEVTVYHSGQLVSVAEELAALKSGTIQATLAFTAQPEAIEPLCSIWNMPFAFDVAPDNMDHISKFVDSPKGATYFIKAFEEKGYKVVAMVPTDVGMTYCNNTRPITKAEEGKGLKMRMPAGGYLHESAKILGISPITIAGPEVPTALKQGVVDGVYSTPIFMYDSAWSPLKYLTGDYIASCTCPFEMHMDFFKSLPTDIQGIIDQKLGPELKDYCRKRVMEEAAKKLDIMKKELGTQIILLTPAEKARWRTMFQPLYDGFAKVPGGKEMLDEVNRLR